MHQVVVVGNVGRDPELKYTAAGKAVCTISVAVNESWSKDGERQERTLWFRCVAFDSRAEAINKHVQKRDKVFIVGKLQSDDETGGPRLYKKNNGDMAAQFEIVIDAIEFGAKRQE